MSLAMHHSQWLALGLSGTSPTINASPADAWDSTVVLPVSFGVGIALFLQAS